MQLWIETLHRQHQHKRRKKLRRSSPISYYSNRSATHRILPGGDIDTNPRQTSTTAKLQFVHFVKRLYAQTQNE